MEAEVSFGAWVSRQRRALDLTRSQLARHIGCSVSALRKIESDERRPSRQLAELLAEYLQVSPDQRLTFLQVARGYLPVERLARMVFLLPTSVVSDVLSSHPVSHLPPLLTPLIGREAELATLARLLYDPQCRLLTLTGPGGIGKTRLALEAATRQNNLFADGVCFVSLAPLTSPQFMAPAIADALGFAFSGPVEPTTQLLNYLRKKRLLLVLDNFEHLLEGSDLLATLLLQAPEVRFLVTSRERLNLKAEWVFEIQGLPIPPTDPVADVDEYSAVALFVQSARRAQASFALQPEAQAAVVRICQMVEGMPLGIELAAAWVSVLTCHEIAQEIERGLDFLATSMRDVPRRQQSLRATFDHSWSLLSTDERSALGRLAIFQGGFSRKAAEHVAGATLFSLSALVSKSLVRHKESGRYDLHEVIRQYALAHLADDPQSEMACDRHSNFYLTLLRNREKPLKSAAQRETIRELTAEIDNIRAAWAWAIEHEKFGAIQPALRCFGGLFEIAGWLGEGIEQLDLVVQAIRARPDNETRQKALGEALTLQSLLLFRRGQFERASALLDESLARLRPFNDPASLSHPLLYRGIIMHLNGELDRAQALLSEGLACAQTAGDRWCAIYADFNLGYIASLTGRYEKGYKQMSDNLVLWRTLGDPRSIALGLNFLSPTVIKLGCYEEAQAFLEESLRLCTQVGDRWGMGTAYRYLGVTALAQGNIPNAEALLYKSLDVFDKFVTGWDIVCSLVYLGEIKLAAGDLFEARQIFLKTLRLAMEAQATPLALDVLVGLAHLQKSAEQALELSICVLNHPAATHEAKDRARRRRAQLEAQLTPQQVEVAYTGGQAQSFTKIVAQLLGEEV